jgi:hypothetical protein
VVRGVGRSLREGLGLGLGLGYEIRESDENEREVVIGFRFQRWLTNPHS